MAEALRVAYTLEQCWHDVPGGTAVAALQVARRLIARDDIDLVGVAGRHRRRPEVSVRPPMPVRSLPLARPWLYESWNRIGWPRIERATGPVDVCHSTTAIPAPTRAPHVVTVHDSAFVHTPERFSTHGARVMRAGLERCRDADLVLCPSRATADDLRDHGFDPARLRVVPWGVEVVAVSPATVERLRDDLDLPTEFVLFVGTLEPRKNLHRLAEAVRPTGLPLVAAGAAGWGDGQPGIDHDVRFLGFVPEEQLPVLYAAAAVFAYPSLHEGFGLPVVEAMAQGAPVVTSAGTSMEEVADGAAVLVDPTDVESITSGLERALADAPRLRAAGRARAAALTWERCADATVDAYRAVAS